MAYTRWMVISFLVTLKISISDQIDCSSLLTNENLQQTTAFPNHATTVSVGESVTLACNRSQGIQNAVKWHVYTKEIGHIPINLMFDQKGLSHLLYEEGNDGIQYTLTLSNFSSSIGDYFVVCSVQSGDGGCYTLYPIQPYIITALDTATTTTTTTTTAPATTDGCATTTTPPSDTTTSGPVTTTDTSTDADTDQTTAATDATTIADVVPPAVRETLDNITLNLATIDGISSRLDYISWYLVMVTSLLLLMNSALVVMVVGLCCRGATDKSPSLQLSPPLPLGVTNRYAIENGLTTSILK